MELTKSSIITTKYFHVFKDANGSEFRVACTKSNYNDLAKNIYPTDLNGTWVSSHGHPTVAQGCWGQHTVNMKVLNMAGNIVSIDSDFVASGTLLGIILKL